MHHCFLDPERYEGQKVIFTPFSEGFINDVALSMKICVALFVFLSGYGIMLGYKRKCNGCFDNLDRKIISRSVASRGIKLWTSFVFIFFVSQIYELVAVRNGHFLDIYGNHGIKPVIYYFIDMSGLAQFFGTPTYLDTFWYISLAWIIIFTIPPCIYIYNRFGGLTLCFLCLLFSVLFPISEEHTFSYFPNYAFTMCLGMICAQNNTIVRISEYKKIPGILKFLIYIILVLVFVCCRQLTRTLPIIALWNGLISMLICILFFEFINRWFGIRKCLEIIGIYSANIFMLHNFIRVIFYYDFTYSFRYWWLIVLVLLAISLCVAVILEGMKKIIKYDKLVSFLLRKTDSILSR